MFPILFALTVARATPPAWLRPHLICHHAVQTNLPNLPVRFINQLVDSRDEQDQILNEQWDHLMVFPGRLRSRLGLWLLQMNQTYFVDLPEVLRGALSSDDLSPRTSKFSLVVNAPEIAAPIGLDIVTAPTASRRIFIEAYRPLGPRHMSIEVTAQAQNEETLENVSAEILFLGTKASQIKGGLSSLSLANLDQCRQGLDGDGVAAPFLLGMDRLSQAPAQAKAARP